MPGSDFRDLVAYRLAAAVGNDIYEEVVRWEKFPRWTLGIQLVRSLDSVAANIAEAEGRGRQHPADRRRLLLVARGSLYEAEHWMLQAEARGLLPEDSSKRLNELARTLNGLVRRPA